MKNIYLLPCTKLKQNYRCAAEEMYKPSALYRLSYSYAINRVTDKNEEIFILSDKHYLMPLSKEIDPYDETLRDMSLAEKKKWGQIVYDQMKETFDMATTHFIFLTGKEYMNPIIPYLECGKYSNPIPSQYGFGDRMGWLKDNMVAQEIDAKAIRNTEYLCSIPKTMPGWYKWWAPKKALKMLLDSPYISKKYFSDLLSSLTTKNIGNTTYYYIYVGVAIKESIRDRLDWHVNQHHTKSSVESGFLSTLRQTIASLVAGNQYNENATNQFIDMLIIEYYPVNLPIKSNKAKEKIEFIEKKELSNNILPLNIRDNKNKTIKKYLTELSSVRKHSK